MRVALDSSAVWSILKGEPQGHAWLEFLIELSREHTLVLCDVVLAEMAPYFDTINDVEAWLRDFDIQYDPIDTAAAFDAGVIFKEYRRQGGTRQRLLPDFLIAAHSSRQAQALATVDMGYLRRYFPTLQLVQPPRMAQP